MHDLKYVNLPVITATIGDPSMSFAPHFPFPDDDTLGKLTKKQLAALKERLLSELQLTEIRCQHLEQLCEKVEQLLT